MSIPLSSAHRVDLIDPADLSEAASSSLNGSTIGHRVATRQASRSRMTFDAAHDDEGRGMRAGSMERRSGYRSMGSNAGEHEFHRDSLGVNDGDSTGQAPPAHMYGSFVAYCFTVNYILGVGVLGMPYAFYKAGWALSSICLGMVTVMASFTALWLVDVSLRAQYVKRQDRLLRAGVLDGEAGGADGLSDSHSVQTPVSSRTQHRYEMNELVEMFMGVRARRFYELLVIIYLVGALWSYTSVFASSLASHVPLPGINGGEECDIYKDNSSSCSSLYYTYVAMFAVVVVPLTCLDLTEMKLLQIVLALFRFVSLGTMMATSVAAIYSYPSPDASAHSPAEKPYVSGDFKAFDWANLGLVFPVAVYSQIFHHSVPGLSHPLTDKRKTPRVFVSVLITTMFLYTLLGITVAAYYGGSIPQTCTIEWANYTGGHDQEHEKRPGWASFIGYLVVLFPPIDIISAFPLNAITLGNNLLCAFVEDEQKQQMLKYKLPFRLLAALPPIIGSLIVRDLGVILKYTGCVGVLIAFVYPCVLQWRSVAECKRRDIRVQLDVTRTPLLGDVDSAAAPGPASHSSALISRKLGIPTYNHSFVSHPRLIWGVMSFAVVGLVAVIALSIAGLSD